ncbi:MAG: biopolymer transporter ExbD [Alphaproteobacteria bacterium]|nr:biopolymer transporter ExbD [Alphaproteobacteria bacterium]
MLGRSRHRRITAEVNLTPLIDVMMSLLAIFMITAPLLTTGIPLNLPKGDGRQIQGQDKTLDISINAKGEIYVGKIKLTMDQLLPKIQAITEQNPKIQIMISADKTAAYGTVVEVMALLRQAGYTQVGLKTDVEVVSSRTKKTRK